MLPTPLHRHRVEARLATLVRERARNEVRAEGATPSAVLMGLFERDDDVHLWLVRRPDKMRSHAGQVAFPGGKRDPEDTSLAATALREAEEEIGLGAEHLELIGAMDDLVTGTGFVITPYVAWVSPSFAPRANPAEVARVFSAPLRLFGMRAAGVFPKIGHHYDGEFVWGATLMMGRSLVLELARELARELTGG
jgi:8-oxo-dGTP pyrophosphatase MutT (NUDIX family)